MTTVYRLAAGALLVMMTCASHAPAQQQDATPPPQTDNAAGPLKKRNARPADAQPAGREPFDDATVARMAESCVTIETEAGAIEIEMLAETAPNTVRNFLNLAAIGALDTTTFSRVVKDFVIQGGNLTTRQILTPELARRARRMIPDEPNLVKHVRGIVSMARADQPNSATTNFFILVGEAAHLDGTFAAFGRVARGMDVVDAINRAPTDGEKPAKPVRVTRAVTAACSATRGGTRVDAK